MTDFFLGGVFDHPRLLVDHCPAYQIVGCYRDAVTPADFFLPLLAAGFLQDCRFARFIYQEYAGKGEAKTFDNQVDGALDDLIAIIGRGRNLANFRCSSQLAGAFLNLQLKRPVQVADLFNHVIEGIGQ